MRLRTALETKKMDIRLRDKLLAEGKLTKEELTKYLSELPDESDNYTLFDPRKKESKPAPQSEEQLPE